MKPNDPILDPAGNPARLITMPIPGRRPALAVILYPDGRGRLIDLAQCRPLQQQQTALQQQQNSPRSNQ